MITAGKNSCTPLTLEMRRGESMPRPLRVLGFSGSLRKASLNTGLLHAAREMLPEGMTDETERGFIRKLLEVLYDGTLVFTDADKASSS